MWSHYPTLSGKKNLLKWQLRKGTITLISKELLMTSTVVIVNTYKSKGLHSEQELTNTPWHKIAVDLKRTVFNYKRTLQWWILWIAMYGPHYKLVWTYIYTDIKTKGIIAQKFDQTLLACYPRPIQVAHDIGGKFTVYSISRFLRTLGIKGNATTSQNPFSKAFYKQMH